MAPRKARTDNRISIRQPVKADADTNKMPTIGSKLF